MTRFLRPAVKFPLWSTQISHEQTFPQLCEESSALLPKTVAYFVFFLQDRARISQQRFNRSHISISAKLWGDSPFFPFTYTCGTNPWTVLKQTSRIFRVLQISLSREDLTHFGATRPSNSNRRWLNPGDDQVHYNLFCGTVLALGNDQQRRPWAKNRTESWGRFHFHEPSLWDNFLGVVLYCSITCCRCCHVRAGPTAPELKSYNEYVAFCPSTIHTFEDGWKSRRSWVNWDALCWQKLVQAMVTVAG